MRVDELIATKNIKITHEDYYHPLCRWIVNACYELGWEVEELFTTTSYEYGLDSQYPVRLGVILGINKRVVTVYSPVLNSYSLYEDQEKAITKAVVQEAAAEAAGLNKEEEH